MGESASGLAQGDGSGQGITLGSDVIGRDLMRGRIKEEEGEVMLAGHADVSLVPSGGVAQRRFVAQIKEMAVVGSGLGVVEDGLIAEANAEDLAEDLSGFAGGKRKRDVQG